MPSKSKQKGNRGEYELRDLLREKGYSARRVPQSGSSPDSPGDLLVCTDCVNCAPGSIHPPPCNNEEIWEVKRRRQGFKQIEKWLDDAYAVCYRRDRGEWIITLRLEDYLG